MPDWALASGYRVEDFGTDTATTAYAVQVVAAGTANTKGSWTELIASTSFDATAMHIVTNTGFGDRQYLLDIGVGAAGSEQVLIPNVLVGCAIRQGTVSSWPIGVPAGSRIAARIACSTASSGMNVSGMLYAGGFVNAPSFSAVTDYGTDTGNSRGTTVDAGASAGTKGSYTQIVASTTSDHDGLIIAAIRPAMSVSVAASYAVLADVAIGAASSEQVLIPNLRFVCASGVATQFPQYIPIYPCSIPSGSRIAIRQQANTTDAQDRTSSFIVYGIN